VVTVNELRSVVRTQTQTDVADLPDVTIDVYLQQAFERTLNAETRWPFYAQSWDLVLDPDANTMTLAGDVAEPGIMALIDTTSGARLGMVPHVWAEDRFAGSQVASGPGLLYSVWGNKIYLWPQATFSESRPYRLRGYRTPLQWLTPGDEPDCDQRLHLPLTHYACALAYAQQEDEVLESTYMARWQADVQLAHRAIMDPVHHRPLQMSGMVNYGYAPSVSYVVVPP
jgi:hypothetical protein